VACWLLVSRTSSVTEERVFAIGGLLLLGGPRPTFHCHRSSAVSLRASSGAPQAWTSAIESHETLVIFNSLSSGCCCWWQERASRRHGLDRSDCRLRPGRIVGKLAGSLLARRFVERREPQLLPLSPVSSESRLLSTSSRFEPTMNIAAMLFTSSVVGSLASDAASLLVRETEPAT